MGSPRWGLIALSVALLATASVSACRAHYVVVPAPGDAYTAADTLWGWLDGDEVRVTFRFDTVTRLRVDTVLRVDTLRLAAADTQLRPPRRTQTVPDTRARIDTVFQIDTVRVTETVVRVDTVQAPGGPAVARVDTVFRVDTMRVTETVLRVDTIRIPSDRSGMVVDTVVRVDTLRLTDEVVRLDTVQVFRIDTIRVERVDTVQVVVADTVVRTETVRVPGPRMLFVPPGQYPPQGQCRVWIHNRPPGQQAAAAPCDELGEIPEGAFILFGGEAWDFDYDWVAEVEANPGAAPPEVVSAIRRGRP